MKRWIHRYHFSHGLMVSLLWAYTQVATAETLAPVTGTTPKVALTNAPASTVKQTPHKMERGHSQAINPDKKQDLLLTANYVLPSDSTVKADLGAELQWRHWQTRKWGWLLAAGTSQWTPDAQALSFPEYYTNPRLSGSATTYPLGASLLMRRPMCGDFDIILEGGLRYVIVSSGIEVSFDFTNHQNNEESENYLVTIDDRVLAVAGVAISHPLTRTCDWFLGAGFQHDLAGGDNNWLYNTIANDFSGVSVRVGVNWSL